MAEPVDLEFDPETSAGPLDPAFVEKTEQMIGVSFDPVWLDLLSHQNGGVPRKRYFTLGRNAKVVERFLPIVDRRANPALAVYDVGVVWSDIEDRLSPYMVPFASLFPGDFLCFDHEGGGRAKVVWWLHEASERRQPKTEPVAEDFDRFLGMLTAQS